MNKLLHGQQIIVDKIVTAKHTITGQDFARSVLKATTDELVIPKRKHVDYLINCTDDPEISITEMSRMLLDRAHNSNWTIAFKAMLTIHELLNYGNERFFQYLASDNSSMSFEQFSDRTDGIALHMSKFVRAYGKYLSSKATSFRIVGYDFCKVKRGGKDAFFRRLDTPKLFEGLCRLQIQLDDLLRFDPTPHDLSNSIIRLSYTFIFKDLVRLISCYNDGITNLIEKFFDMDKKNGQEAYLIYKKYVAHIRFLVEFFKDSESMNVDRMDIPKLQNAPIELTSAMEEHLRTIEVNKRQSTTPVSPLPKPESKHSDKRKSLQLQKSLPASGSFGDQHISLGEISSQERKKIIDEEKKHFELLKRNKASEISTAAASVVASRSRSMFEPRSSNQAQNNNIIDFEVTTTATTSTNTTSRGATTDSNNNNVIINGDSVFGQLSTQENMFNDNFWSSSSSSALPSSSFSSSSSSSSSMFTNSDNLFSNSAFSSNATANNPPGFSNASGILEPKKLYSNPPQPSTSLATLDFSKMSLPPNPIPVFYPQSVSSMPQQMNNPAYPRPPGVYYPIFIYAGQTTPNLNSPPPVPQQQPGNPSSTSNPFL